MKSQGSHQAHKKRVSSNHHLPLINKQVSLRQYHKQNNIKQDISFELANQYQKSRILPKQLRKRVSSNKSNKIVTFRLRTDSVSSSINKQQQNKSLVEYQNNSKSNFDLTLENFNKHIKQNKQYIKGQRKKRNQIKNKQCKENNDNKKEKKLFQCTLFDHKKTLTQEDAVFYQIKKIIKNKIVIKELDKDKDKNTKNQDQNINLTHIQQLIKLAKINQNMRKMSPQKSINQLKKSMSDQVKQYINLSPLKDQNNYHQWRRVEINPSNQIPRYRQSTFDIQNQRLEQFATKNQISLSNYLQFRKQLQNFKKWKFTNHNE